jgi:uncharacterized membrane protein
MAEAAQRKRWIPWAAWGAVGAVLLVATWPVFPHLGAAFAGASLHAPDWALFAPLSPQIKLHIAAAMTALGIGTVILLRPKGRGLHKALGWGWVISMGVTAVSSLFITGLNGDFFSFVHLISGWTIVALPMAVYAIRRGNVKAHRGAMTSMFVGGLLVAGAFAFIPGRFMFEFFFG